MIFRRLAMNSIDLINRVTNYILFRNAGVFATMYKGKPMVAVYTKTLFEGKEYVMDFGTFLNKFSTQFIDQITGKLLIPDVDIDLGYKIEGVKHDTTIMRVPAWAVPSIGADAVNIVAKVAAVSQLLGSLSSQKSATDTGENRTVH